LASVLATIKDNNKVLQEKMESNNKELCESNKNNEVEFNNQALQDKMESRKQSVTSK
jgi:hypothetical protein